MTSGPRVKWDGVKSDMKMMWIHWGPKRRRPTWGLGGKGVKVDLQWGQIAKLWEPCQELSYLEGCHPQIPGGGAKSGGCVGQLKRWATMWLRGVATGAGGVIGPAYGVAVGLEPWTLVGSELGKGASVRLGQQLFGWVYWRENGHEHFVRCFRPDDLLYHLTSKEASG